VLSSDLSISEEKPLAAFTQVKLFSVDWLTVIHCYIIYTPVEQRTLHSYDGTFRTDFNINMTLQILSRKETGRHKTSSTAEYIAYEYPSDGKIGFVNKFEYEFVGLYDDMDNRKNMVSVQCFFDG
jgi:hypothetical protein